MPEDLSWTKNPPSIDNPEEAAKADELLKREANVPRGHDKADDVRDAHEESVLPPPSRLDPELAWFFPSLAYCMMGMDKSLFELYAKHLNKSIKVTTFRTTEMPVAFMDGADVTHNPWFYTVQGVEPEIGMGFVDYIETFKFTDKTRNLDWSLTVQDIRMKDPFDQEGNGVWARLLLPNCLTTRRVVRVKQEPGLQLNPLVLGIEVKEA